MIRVIHPGSGSRFFTHPGSDGQKGIGSGSATLIKTIFCAGAVEYESVETMYSEFYLRLFI
jgi:hypothetical protein